MAGTARSNLELVAAAQTPPARVTVVSQEVLRWLRQVPDAGSASNTEGAAAGFDLIYADPPYAAGLYGAIAKAVAERGWLKDTGVLLLECGSGNVPEELPGWRLVKERRYGGSTVLMLQQPSNADEQQTMR
jgi:16S rRNA G966 N2-methylase RsmD